MATSYVWSYPGNLADEQTGLTHSISLNSIQTVPLTAFYRNQCGDGPSASAYNVEVKAQPTVLINAVPSICQGESISLSATASGNYSELRWSSTSGKTATGTSFDDVYNKSETVTFLATVTAPGCIEARDDKEVTPRIVNIDLRSESISDTIIKTGSSALIIPVCGDETIRLMDEGAGADKLSIKWIGTGIVADSSLSGASIKDGALLLLTKEAGCDDNPTQVVS